MKLTSFISEENIFINNLEGSKDEIVGQMVKQLASSHEALDQDKIIEELSIRESQISSYIGNGVAMPHARIESLDEISVSLATFQDGIDWGLPGGDEVHLIFLILSPGDQNTLMLQSIAAISKICQSKETRETLCKVKTPSKLLKYIEETGVDVKKTINAADIMRTDILTLKQEMTLREAAIEMSQGNLDGFPVVTGDGSLIGEISSAELLKVGMTSYVDLLSDDSFLTNFEPFEQYFKQENKTTISEIMNKDVLTCSPNTPIIKVAHQLIQNNKRRVYITSENSLQGIIYSKDILTKVLHL